MANPGSVWQQIGESFEQIGKDVARETVKVPKDIAGIALETLGSSSGKKNPKQQSPQDQKDEDAKKAVARKALEEISSGEPKQKELSVWEKIQQEEQQKKELEKKKKEEAAKQVLPKTGTKRPRGDLYGIKVKKASAEMSRNVRQD